MTKLPLFAGMTLLTVSAFAQSSGFGPPTFNCAVGDTYQDQNYNGVIWKCGPTANTWAPIPAYVPWQTPTNTLCLVGNGHTWVGGSCSGASGVTSIDTLTGAFTFGGSGVSHVGNAYTFSGGGGSGTVTSVGLALPAFMTVSGSPVTTTGTLTATLASQTANQFFAAPNGSAGAPGFRAIVAADIPTLNQSTTGNAATATALAATPAQCTGGQYSTGITANGTANCGTPSGARTVTSFSAGTLSPLFTTSVATATSTPALTFTQSTAAANTVFGNFTASAAVPTFSATPTFSGANITALNMGNAASGTLAVGRGGTGATTLTGPIKGNGTSAFTAAAAADIYGLWSGTCSSTTFLRGDGSCQTPSGSGNTTSTSLTTSSLSKANGANSIINSLFTDDGTNGAYTGTGGFTSSGAISSGTAPVGCSASGCLAMTEAGTGGTPTAGTDYLRADSTSHTIKMSLNGGAEVSIPTSSGTTTIASGTATLGTSSIASAACATVVTVTATGVASTDAINWNPNGSIKAITGYTPSTSGGLTISAYPTTNAVNYDVCNWTASSITPGAVTLNWRVVR